jgi:hypothetical protein
MVEIVDKPISGATTIWEDNQSAIAYSRNGQISENTKHIDFKWHFLKDHVEHGTIMLMYLPIERMVADMITKPLPWLAPARHTSAVLRRTDPMQRVIPYLSFGGVLLVILIGY